MESTTTSSTSLPGPSATSKPKNNQNKRGKPRGQYAYVKKEQNVTDPASDQPPPPTSSSNNRGKPRNQNNQNPRSTNQQPNQEQTQTQTQPKRQPRARTPVVITAPPSHPLYEQHQQQQNQQNQELNEKKKQEKPEKKQEPKQNKQKEQKQVSNPRKIDHNTKSQQNKQSVLKEVESSEMATKLARQLKRNTYECIICFEKVSRKAAIWTCRSCYAIFHVRCIAKWSKQPAIAAANAENDQPASKINTWNCPGCRHEEKGYPKSSCFCGKTDKPRFDPFLIPHSCGDQCRRKRPVDVNSRAVCPHICAVVCHPGPCPPCSALAPPQKCFCGKTSYQLRCGQFDEGQSCLQNCGRKLSCGVHTCSLMCHGGDCPPCDVAQKQHCYCGQHDRDSVCGQGIPNQSKTGYYSCGETCNRPLSCGNHQCTQQCHIEACAPCPRGIHLTHCPCGATRLSELLTSPRTSCLDPIPTCGKTCNKWLHCGKHACPLPCHEGACPPCESSSLTLCRCGAHSYDVPCKLIYPQSESSENVVDEEIEKSIKDGRITIKDREVLCTTRCESKRQCGRHRCNTECCPMKTLGADAHPCPLPCGKLLTCKLHKCAATCHKGKCLRCPNVSFDEQACRCGRTINFPPILCGAPPPECTFPCTREHLCDHEVNHNCHYNAECPKCFVLVSRRCGCGKEVLPSVQCHNQFPSCGNRCQKPLRCGLHKCNRYCHPGECTSEPAVVNENDPLAKPSCGGQCGAELMYCMHPCTAKCHPGESCPNVVCQADVTVICPCGQRKTTGKCLRGGENGLGVEESLLQTKTPSSVGAYVRLNCDDTCALKARQLQLALAFGRTSSLPGQPQKPESTNYSSFLTSAASVSTQFVKKVELMLLDFIQQRSAVNEPLAPEASVYRFPVMNSYYRHIIHELAPFYGLESRSEGVEPNRYVTVSKTSHSMIPKTPLHVLISQFPTPLLPGTGEGVNKLQPAALLFYNLSPSIKSEHLHNVLKLYRNEYCLKWIDDANAVAIFNDETTMRVAAYAVSSNRHFQVKPLSDLDVSDLFATFKPIRSGRSAVPDSAWDATAEQPDNDSNEVKQEDVLTVPVLNDTPVADWTELADSEASH